MTRTSMGERRPENETAFKTTKGFDKRGFSMNSTQSSIPSVLLKHVPAVKMNRITWRDDLFD